MKNNPLQLIPTLLLADGKWSNAISEKFMKEMERLCGGSACGICYESLGDDINKLETFICGPQPEAVFDLLNHFHERQGGVRIHPDWPMHEPSAQVIMLCDRTWIDDQKDNLSISANTDRQVLLIIIEDSSDLYSDDDFFKLFDWIASLEFISSCWWLDNQTQDLRWGGFERRKQALSWLHCLVCDAIAGCLLQPHFVTSRTLCGSQPEIIGSMRTLELFFNRKNLLTALISIYLDGYLFRRLEPDPADNAVQNQLDQELETFKSNFKKKKWHYDEMKTSLDKLLKDILHLTGLMNTRKYLKDVEKVIDQAACFYEIEQDRKIIDTARVHFSETLEKFIPSKPEPVPPLPPKIMPWWIIITLGLLVVEGIVAVAVYKTIFVAVMAATIVVGIIGIRRFYIRFKRRTPNTSRNRATRPDDQKFEVPPSSSQKSVFLRKCQDMLMEYRDILDTDVKEPLISKEIMDLKDLIIGAGLSDDKEFVDCFSKDDYHKWVDNFTKQLPEPEYSNFRDLYGKCLDEVTDERLKSHYITNNNMAAETVTHLLKAHARSQPYPMLAWRLDPSRYKAKCIIEIGFNVDQDRLRFFKDATFVVGRMADQIKLVHFGQYMGE